MEKTIEISGKKVRFKATGGTTLRYKMQFGREYLSDIAKLDNMKDGNFDNLDLTVFYQIAWVLAKTADNNIPELIEWLDSFEEFPIIDIIADLSELIMSNIKIDRKN